MCTDRPKGDLHSRTEKKGSTNPAREEKIRKNTLAITVASDTKNEEIFSSSNRES